MIMPSLPFRVTWAALLCTGLLILVYPAAFVLTHGLAPAGWPAGEIDPLTWFDHLARLCVGDDRWNSFFAVVGVLLDLQMARASALPLSGRLFALGFVFLGLPILAFIIVSRGKLIPARHSSQRFGNAHWAYPKELKRMRRGLELGRDPATGRAVRVLIEGNLVTIAPPRSGKTSGLILPNIVMPEVGAWGGPVVVIDPKGDAYRAAQRRRTAVGRNVRCLDPLGLIGGSDRWNPLLRLDPQDTVSLLSCATALLPEDASEANQYFRDRAGVLVAAALHTVLRNGEISMAAAAASDLVRDLDAFADALADQTDALSREAHLILTLDPRSRDSLLSTAGQALQFLLDERLRAVTSDHTIDLAELAGGNLDLFIVIPADDRRNILAPYLRWLLSELFAAIRENRPSERILVIIDEAFVLGRFDAILRGVGELPGYGVSLWTFWQSRAQMIDTYGEAGADVLLDTAEVTSLFNTSRVRPDEAEYWSRALGTFTGVNVSTAPGAQGREVETRSAVEERLVPAVELNGLTRRQAIHFLSGGSHTPDPVLLDKTRPFDEARFAGLLDPVEPVGRLRA